MLVFVIPLKSKKTSHSWDLVCKLFERCLKSVCNQNDPNFRVIVVCNEQPNIQFNHPNLDYIKVDFLPPEFNRQQQEKDKARKIIIGLKYASKFKPHHAMMLDADDCLSCHLANYTNQHPDSNGWFLNNGYVYQENSPFIYYRKSHFHHWCGSCNIVNFNLLPLPDVEQDYPEELLEYYSGNNHRNIEKIMSNQGTPLNPLPLLGAVYIIGNGENIYQHGFSTIHNANRNKPLFWLKEIPKFRVLTSSIRKEFGLTKL